MKLNLEEIADAIPVEALREDIERLNKAGPLVSQGGLDVYVASADEIPNILPEIGLQREITFRSVGEGVGRARDNDHYDDYYLQLFLWDRENERVAGGYRMGRTDIIIKEHGFDALYTATHSKLDQSLIDYLNPGLELGRSWIHPDYQKSLHSLLGLWKGLGAFATRHPQYHKFFGGVSISNDYTTISKNLMVKFLRRTNRSEKWSRSLQARIPFNEVADDLTSGIASIEECSAQVSALEPDGKGVPVLLRQYLKLNATLFDFSVDPLFQDALHAMVLVDLRVAPSLLLKKYMGQEGYTRFSEGVVEGGWA